MPTTPSVETTTTPKPAAAVTNLKTPTVAAAARGDPYVPSYLYYILAFAVALALILLVQVIYVRIKLSKYTKDEYYKQLLVKNEYNNTQSTACSN